MANQELTVSRVRELFDYDPTTGHLTWRVRKAIRLRIGDVAGCQDDEGYISIKIDRKAYKAHRLIWLHVHGVWPLDLLDHRNGDPSDNRLSNLREATTLLNSQNQRTPQKSNRSGFLGVSKLPSGLFQANLYFKGRRILQETFLTAEDASAAYQAAKCKFHPFATLELLPQFTSSETRQCGGPAAIDD